MTLGAYRALEPVLATGAILLLLCGVLCVLDDDSADTDLCLLVLAVASAAFVILALELAGPLVSPFGGVAYLTPAEIRPPPPKR